VFIHPPFLLRSTEAYPQQVRNGIVYPSYERLVLCFSEITKRRRVRPRNDYAECFAKTLCESFSNTWCATIKKVTVSSSRFTAERLHQLWSVNPALE